MEWALIDQDGPVRSGRTPDGTRVLWHPADGPTSARLTFRVGVADETLPTRGITHLVEHLAHERIGLPLYECNAHVGTWCTSFDVSGDVPQVVTHLQELGGALHDLPLERMDQEIGVLRLEEARHGRSPWDELIVHRYGLRGPGLAAVGEAGLDHLRPAQVRSWALTSFAAGGAVLSVHGAEPTEAWLALPAGPGRSVPSVRLLPGRVGSWASGGEDAVSLAVLAPDRPATTAAWSWWHHRLRQRLRIEDRSVYDVDLLLTRLPGGWLELGVRAATDPARREAVLRAVEQVAAQACATGPDPDEVDAHERREHAASRSAGTPLDRLDAMARDWLVGGSAPGAPARDHDGDQLTREHVRSHLADLLGRATWQVPPGCPPPAGLAPAGVATTLGRPLPGRVFVGARHRSSGHRLVIGPLGVTVHLDGGATLGMTWDDCVAVVRYPDGSRVLTVVDGSTLEVDPREWLDGAAAAAELDRVTPAHLVLHVTGTPRPDTARPHRLLTGLSRLSSISLTVLALATGFCGLLLAGSASGAVHPVAVGVVATVPLVACVALLLALVRRLRVPRARRRDPGAVGRTHVSVAVDRAMARANRPVALAVAVGAWAVTVAALAIGAWRGVAFWPALFLVGFAVRATREVARRPR